MIHIYEIEGHGKYWEVWKEFAGQPWQDQYIRSLEDENELFLYLDICREMGVDFVIHNNDEEYDEYHIALPSV